MPFASAMPPRLRHADAYYFELPMLRCHADDADFLCLRMPFAAAELPPLRIAAADIFIDMPQRDIFLMFIHFDIFSFMLRHVYILHFLCLIIALTPLELISALLTLMPLMPMRCHVMPPPLYATPLTMPRPPPYAFTPARC